MTTTCQGRGCHNLLLPKHMRGPAVRREVLWCSDRCRKTKYSVPCVDCGEPLNGSDGRGPNAPMRCVLCSGRWNGSERKVWTRAAIVLAMQEWAAEYGDAPAMPDWDPTQAEIINDSARADRFRAAAGRWPTTTTVFKEWRSWNTALVAAGFQPRAPHGGGGNEQRMRSMRAKAAA